MRQEGGGAAMQSVSVTITPSEDGRTVRSILKGRLGISSHVISGLTRTERGILVNSQRAYSTAVLHAGDVLTADLSDRRETRAEVLPGPWPLEVVWEDEWLLVANKPAGMVSLVSSFHPETPTVAGALAWSRGTDTQFHIVNRLDKGTTGLLVVAKCGYIHALLQKQLHTGDFHREYRGICIGCPAPQSGVIDLPIGRDETSAVARQIRPDGARAVTHYETLRSDRQYSLLRLLPETGRTHQLRLHLSAVGHPLVGDWLYGCEVPELIARPALHSYALTLRHPVTGERIALTSPLPADMTHLLHTDENSAVR
jgi:23S rRNA pseudouridine1911/1915/1917 synthase